MISKQVLLFSIFLISGQFLLAQKIDVKLDYTVTYLVEKSKDTIQISVGENGKYLYTDSKLIANEMGKKLSAFPGIANKQADIKFLLNTTDSEMLFSISAGETIFLMNLNLQDMIPRQEINADSISSIVSQETMENIALMDKSYSLYHLYSSEDPEDKLIFAFDKNYQIDYQKNFSNLLSLILKTNVTMSLPEGIFIYIKNKEGQEVIRAIDITKETRTISADLNFHIR